jgi:hypothetical protein
MTLLYNYYNIPFEAGENESYSFSFDSFCDKYQLQRTKTQLCLDILIENESKILCQCLECNITKKYVPVLQLINKISKRCSLCGYSNKGEKNPSWKGFGKIPRSKITRIQHGAKVRNINYNLNIEYLSKLFDEQDSKCFYTNLPLSFNDNTASLERIDSNKGYEKDNVVWVHKNLNIMKRDLSIEEFLNICKLVVENFK